MVCKGIRNKNTAKGPVATIWIDNEGQESSWTYAIGITVRGPKEEIDKFMLDNKITDIGDKIKVTFSENT